jgi:hypothetical protein
VKVKVAGQYNTHNRQHAQAPGDWLTG